MKTMFIDTCLLMLSCQAHLYTDYTGQNNLRIKDQSSRPVGLYTNSLLSLFVEVC